ncbi:hypothetical protein [Leptolyngbya sp. 7M]|uniref:hypothetical protein n=1 Tax=Leptolyngbya sp. 7M TaxID=2812896 RepID=UPI001B8CBFC6|nr:hypothetical protein [Leptolyngbya sp. 7M]QYO68892.1 hypothetical protein JVX88_20600 [Leptolyngbya sp. 7M]
MNQKLLSGFTAALLVSTLGLAPSGYADQQQSTDEQSGVSVSESGSAAQVASASALRDSSLENPENAQDQVQAVQPLSQASNGISSATAIPSPSDEKVGEKVSTPAVAPAAAPSASNSTAAESSDGQSVEVVKVGEYQSQDASRANATVATIQPHPLQGRNAATLYVRNIPVLTFLGEAVGQSASGAEVNQPASSSSGAEVKVASTQTTSGTAAAIQNTTVDPLTNSTAPITDAIPGHVSTNSTDSRDPVWRATTTAARLNQLYRDNVSADEIKIYWDAARQQYVIKGQMPE